MDPHDVFWDAWGVLAVVVTWFLNGCIWWELSRGRREPGATFLGLLRTYPSRGFDRVMTGSAEGRLFECFDPAWWHLRRWAWWWTSARRLPRGSVAMVRGSRGFTVRVFTPKPLANRVIRGVVHSLDEQLGELRRRASDGRPN